MVNFVDMLVCLVHLLNHLVLVLVFLVYLLIQLVHLADLVYLVHAVFVVHFDLLSSPVLFSLCDSLSLSWRTVYFSIYFVCLARLLHLAFSIHLVYMVDFVYLVHLVLLVYPSHLVFLVHLVCLIYFLVRFSFFSVVVFFFWFTWFNWFSRFILFTLFPGRSSVPDFPRPFGVVVLLISGFASFSGSLGAVVLRGLPGSLGLHGHSFGHSSFGSPPFLFSWFTWFSRLL